MKQQLALILLIGVLGNTQTTATENVNLLKNGDYTKGLVDWNTSGEVLENNGVNSLCLNAKNNRAISRQPIPIDLAARYRLSTQVVADRKLNQVLVGLVPLDKRGREIFYRHTGKVADSITTLSQTLEKGSDTLLVKANPLWTMCPALYIAFDVKPDDSDLPNYLLVKVDNITTDGENLRVKLTNPVNFSRAAGTVVRLHKDGETYLYTSSIRSGFPGKVEAVGEIGGVSSTNAAGKFRPGTVAVKVFLMVIPNPADTEVKVDFSKVEFVKLESPVQ